MFDRDRRQTIPQAPSNLRPLTVSQLNALIRQVLADTVSRVAERLVREEIERLKALPR